MKKSILLFGSLTLFIHAGFMDSIGDIVESTLSDDEKSVVVEKKSVGTKIKDNFSKKKVESLLDDVVDGVKSTIGIKEKKKEKHGLGRDTVTAMKEVTGLKKIKKDHKIFEGGIMGDMADMIDLEEGDSLGLPSVFGFNKKKDTKVFGSTVLGDTLLGDAKETGTSFYRGFKNTGKSTEFMSGMMYKSSKIYNGMFNMFDDSPFNIFDSKKDRGNSIFDVFDTGNDMLDIFD